MNIIVAILYSFGVAAAVSLFEFILDTLFGKETPCRHCQKRPARKCYGDRCLDCYIDDLGN